MHEGARLLASAAAVLLVLAIAAWIKLMRSPPLVRLDGSRQPHDDNVESASRLLLGAVVMSAVAALLAVGELLAS